MDHLASELVGRHVSATDGDVGRIDDLFLDDERWAVRHLVIDTGDWLAPKRLLLLPGSVKLDVPKNAPLPTRLTREQIKHSPDVDTRQPVSRQHEVSDVRYFRHEAMWSLPNPEQTSPSMGDEHLRSARELIGYNVYDREGSVGTMDDMVIGGPDWTVLRLVVDTKPWWPGGQVQVPATLATRIDWSHRAVHLDCRRDELPTPSR